MWEREGLWGIIRQGQVRRGRRSGCGGWNEGEGRRSVG